MKKWVMGPSWCPQLFFVGDLLGHAQEALQMCEQAANLENTHKLGQIFGSSKNGSMGPNWCLVELLGFVGHDLRACT